VTVDVIHSMLCHWVCT